MNIRLAGQKDLGRIDEIYNQAIALKMATADTTPYTRSERSAWFAVHSPEEFPAYVALEGEKVVGYMTLTAYRPRREALKYAVEVSYFVDEDYRGKGIGSKLLEFGLLKASDLGYKFVIAILMGHNEPSIRLLKKYGFSEWGRLPEIAIYDDSWYDHLLYGMKL
jgi:L-amino acid N-acyltransferase YncA